MRNSMSILIKRDNYKPFEYPQIMQYVDAINKSFWVHSEVDFTADIQDFHSKLSETEKEVIKRSLLGIAQVEIGVKTFWGNLYNMFPKPEFNGLGATFAECEFRHSEAYSRLIEVLGYSGEFEKLLEVPIFKKRLAMISTIMKSSNSLEKLLFFTLVIENTSLFSQFANILSFTRFEGYMKNVSNIIAWTSVDEQIHAEAGIFLINEYCKEIPLTESQISSIYNDIEDFIEVESELLDWIFEQGELKYFSKTDLINFMKYRIDKAIAKIDILKTPVFFITEDQYKPMAWFEEEINVNSLDDFFAKRPVDYTKHDKSITAKDLF